MTMVKIVSLKSDIREGDINRMGVLTGRTQKLAYRPQSEVYMFTSENVNNRYMWVFDSALILIAEVEIDETSPLLKHSNEINTQYMTLSAYKEQIKS